jgi:Ca-activated chloride channel family protein
VHGAYCTHVRAPRASTPFAAPRGVVPLRFLWPFALWDLLLAPAAVAAYLLWQRRRFSYARSFTSREMAPNVVPRAPGWRRHVPAVFYLLGLIALLLGVARPQAALSVPRDRATVVLVIDSSNSMKARDVAPNRLGAARRAAQLFVDQLPERFRVGVVSFASRARILNRPTTDRVAVRRALGSLETRLGTAIGDGLARALESTSSPQGGSQRRRPPTVVLLLSDGINTTGEVDPYIAARRARRAKVRVFTITVGDPQRSGGRSARPPNPALLQQIARITGGEFFSAPSSARLDAVYRNLGSSIATVREQREVTVAFVGAGLVLLAAGAALSTVWFNRLP